MQQYDSCHPWVKWFPLWVMSAVVAPYRPDAERPLLNVVRKGKKERLQGVVFMKQRVERENKKEEFDDTQSRVFQIR